MEFSALQYVRGELSKKEYLHYSLDGLTLSSQCEGMENFSQYVKFILTQGFWKLDKLARSDEFWYQSNQLPTLSKLASFAEYCLKRDENDIEAAWLSVCSGLINNNLRFELLTWKAILIKGRFELAIFVRLNWNLSVYTSEQNIAEFAKLVIGLGIDSDVLFALEELATISRAYQKRSEDDTLQNAQYWIEAVVQILAKPR